MPAVPTGCACRDSVGHAHTECLARFAAHAAPHRGPAVWVFCGTCTQQFTGPALRALAERYALSELALDAALCARAAGLPNHHRDPFDRFIIAAALDRNLPVVTVDRQFAAYGVTVVA